MLQGISNTLASLPVAGIACTTTGLYIGRNFCAAALYKIGSIGAKVMASKNTSEWDQTSHEYLTLAKKNGIRDLTAAAGLITIGLASEYAKEKTPPKEESSYLQDYGLPVAAGGGLLAVGLVIGRKIGMKIGSALKRTNVLETLILAEKSGLISNKKFNDRKECLTALKDLI
jgi:hypothetical protein